MDPVADKSNKVAISNKNGYYARVDTNISNSPTKKRKTTKNLLPEIVNEVKTVMNKCSKLVAPQLKLVKSIKANHI